jgi:hypothetical protein
MEGTRSSSSSDGAVNLKPRSLGAGVALSAAALGPKNCAVNLQAMGHNWREVRVCVSLGRPAGAPT